VDAGVTETLVDLNGAAFVVSGLLLSLSLAAAGVGLVRDASLPSWLAWWPVVAGATGVVAAAVGIVDPEHYVPIPFLLLLLWMIALGVSSVVSGPRTTKSADERLAATP
jgi:hypothetical protein